jgi:hypothetical protein
VHAHALFGKRLRNITRRALSGSLLEFSRGPLPTPVFKDAIYDRKLNFIPALPDHLGAPIF